MRAQADDALPAWAYAVNPPEFKVQPDDGTPRIFGRVSCGTTREEQPYGAVAIRMPPNLSLRTAKALGHTIRLPSLPAPTR
jgi:hypothetical protein